MLQPVLNVHRPFLARLFLCRGLALIVGSSLLAGCGAEPSHPSEREDGSPSDPSMSDLSDCSSVGDVIVEPTDLGSVHWARGFRLDGDSLYFATNHQQLYRVAKSGGVPVAIKRHNADLLVRPDFYLAQQGALLMTHENTLQVFSGTDGELTRELSLPELGEAATPTHAGGMLVASADGRFVYGQSLRDTTPEELAGTGLSDGPNVLAFWRLELASGTVSLATEPTIVGPSYPEFAVDPSGTFWFAAVGSQAKPGTFNWRLLHRAPPGSIAELVDSSFYVDAILGADQSSLYSLVGLLDDEGEAIPSQLGLARHALAGGAPDLLAPGYRPTALPFVTEKRTLLPTNGSLLVVDHETNTHEMIPTCGDAATDGEYLYDTFEVDGQLGIMRKKL